MIQKKKNASGNEFCPSQCQETEAALRASVLVRAFYLLWMPVVTCVNLAFFSLLWLLLATVLTLGNLLEFLKYVLILPFLD